MIANQADLAWRCFHCGESFHDERAARLHFGRDERSEAACLIKAGAEGNLLEALRKAEEQADDAIQLMQDEATDAAKAYHSQRCRHTQALIAAEQLGYDRGLEDGRTSPLSANFAATAIDMVIASLSPAQVQLLKDLRREGDGWTYPVKVRGDGLQSCMALVKRGIVSSDNPRPFQNRGRGFIRLTPFGEGLWDIIVGRVSNGPRT